MTTRFLGMDIEPEDWATAFSALSLLAVWYILLTVFDAGWLSLWVFWGGMAAVSFGYSYIYFKKKRDRRIYKIRFLFSALPNYIAFGIFGYSLLTGSNLTESFLFLPLYIITILFIVNATIIYWFSQPKNKKEKPVEKERFPT